MTFKPGNKINLGRRRTDAEKEKNRQAHLGKKHTEEWKQRARLRSMGKKNPFFGKHHVEEAIEKNRLAHIGKSYPNNRGENHRWWRGDDVGYSGIHKRIRKLLYRPELCQNCNSAPSFEVICYTGIYNMDLDNWRWWCRGCHIKYGDSGRRRTYSPPKA